MVVAISVVITVVMCNVVMAVGMASDFLRLPRRNIAITPAFFLSLVPTRRTFVVITIMVVIAVMVIAVSMAVVVATMMFVSAIAVSFCIGDGSQGHTEHECQK